MNVQRSVGFATVALLVLAVLSGVPTASADAGANVATSEDANRNCYQIYLGEFEAGPVTVDASDSCPDVTVDTSQSTIPPCAGDGVPDDQTVGPVTVGITDFCEPFVEVNDDGFRFDLSASAEESDVTGPADPVEDAVGVDCYYDKNLQGWCVITGSSEAFQPNHGTGIHCDYNKDLEGYCYFD